ncbi:MAG TPA: Gfo/Idh/MocA family oxidoreductase [Gemmatimonadales bacterium]|nr:Gfo/Idh/MocA family oxidoreductase [Gemmatimonadales bacterium]
MSRLRVGVIGAGAWGKNHVRTVATLADAELAAVCDADSKTRERLTRQYPAAHITGEVADLLGRVDAVVIASPAATHARVALQCVEAGKPCLVEKPFALSTADADAVARAAAARDVPVLAGHLLVFHPAVERLRALVQGGDLGRIYYLYGLRVNLGQVRADENALWSFGPHDVSVALYLLGEAPVRVAAHGKSYLQPKVEDVVFLTMEFGSGVLAHVQLSWLDPHKERKLTVVGATKMVVFDDMEAREKLRIYDKGVERPPEYGSYGEALSIREGDIFIPKIPNVEPLAAELGHFVRVARRTEPPRAAAADGVAVVKVLDAATRSLHAGGAPIAL